MVIAVTPTEVLAGIISGIVFLLGAIILALARFGARLARIEEWIRVREWENSRK